MTRRHAPRVAALAIALTIAALIVSATRAGGERRPSPASVPLVNADGSVTCRGARYSGGTYSARHCYGRRTVNGTPAAYSVDPHRDLRHYTANAAPGVELRPAVGGETLTWSNDRGAGAVEVRALGQPGGMFTFQVQPGAGATPTFGESGTGLYGDDGALVGVLVELHFDEKPGPQGTPVQIPNGVGWAVQVP